jgi:hypothetical protein
MCQHNFVNKLLNISNLERYKIRRFCLAGAEVGGFVIYQRKMLLKPPKGAVKGQK